MMAMIGPTEWLRFYGGLISYGISIILYICDYTMDIVVGVSLVTKCRDEPGKCNKEETRQGYIILAFAFLPAIAVFVLVLARKMGEYLSQYSVIDGKKVTYRHGNWLRDPQYSCSLVGVDWLEEEEVKEEIAQQKNKEGKGIILKRVIMVTFFIIFRLETFRSYWKLCKITYERNQKDRRKEAEEEEQDTNVEEKLKRKDQRKRADLKFRAGLFIEACFEALPQCCIQLYVYGNNSTVSNAQIISFSLSVLSLCFTFMLSEYHREGELWKQDGSDSTAKIIIPQLVKKRNLSDENCESEDTITRYWDKKGKEDSGAIKLQQGSESHSVTSTFHFDKDAPPTIKVLLKFTRGNDDDKNFLLKTVRVKSNIEDRGYRRSLFFYLRVCDIFMEAPTYFCTAFPSVALFASLYGFNFMTLLIPICFQFAAQYWWWRPKIQKRNSNVSFQTLFLAFKLLLRVLIWGLLILWFLKVNDYTYADNKDFESMLSPIRAVLSPTPNTFLHHIAKYNTSEGKSIDWSECLRNDGTETNETPFSEGNATTAKVYASITKKRHCAFDVAEYVFCVTFFMNFIGIVWECIHYLTFMCMLLRTKGSEWLNEKEYNEVKKFYSGMEDVTTDDTQLTLNESHHLMS